MSSSVLPEADQGNHNLPELVNGHATNLSGDPYQDLSLSSDDVSVVEDSKLLQRLDHIERLLEQLVQIQTSSLRVLKLCSGHKIDEAKMRSDLLERYNKH